MRKPLRGIKCVREEQLQQQQQSKLTSHKARTKRMKKKSVMASKKLRTVTDRKGTTEEVTESLPGKGQTLDGETEDKGKGISKYEENDVSEWSSKKEYHSKIEDSNIERVDGKGSAVERQLCPVDHMDENMEIKNRIEGVDDIPGTLCTPKVVLQRIQDVFSSLQQIWQKIMAEGQSAVTLQDLTTLRQKIEEIEKVQFVMKAIDIIDGDSQSTNEIRIQGPECPHPACYHDGGHLDRYEDDSEEVMKNLLMEKHLFLGHKPPIEKSTFNRITKITGCACGTWCAGPSRSR
ncbi:hypothetical protein sscle_15g105120 [Sclerotinia sclerotiorum 1980 UF-70]|uniref:Uncharacterized protein n=1 Tax=Sclerotinia sclerotiorum (strain ATCC 18683 / 1980 / Ss-1) TaxID=665079 RepID=A0A1D9QLP6_SCLS1|nr:hypothetical protein sscle_15g105120 [Sclerotinia sclerotiorum 1980 UF-70]